MTKKLTNVPNLRIFTNVAQRNPSANNDSQQPSPQTVQSAQVGQTKRRSSIEQSLRKCFSHSNLKNIKNFFKPKNHLISTSSGELTDQKSSGSARESARFRFFIYKKFDSEFLSESNIDDGSLNANSKDAIKKVPPNSAENQLNHLELVTEFLGGNNFDQQSSALEKLKDRYSYLSEDASIELVNVALAKCKEIPGMDSDLVEMLNIPEKLKNPDIFSDVARNAYALTEQDVQSSLMDILTIFCLCKPEVRSEIAETIVDLLAVHQIDQANFANVIRLLNGCVKPLDSNTVDRALDSLALAICIDEMLPTDHAATLSLLDKIIDCHLPSQDVKDNVVSHINEAIKKEYISNDDHTDQGNLAKAQEFVKKHQAGGRN